MSNNFRTVIFGSSGFNNFSILGSLIAFENEGRLYNIDTFVGVSSSSIMALLLALDMSVRDIIDLNFEYDLFNDFHNFSLEILLTANKPTSLEPIRNIIRKILINRFGKVPTFYEFFKVTHKSPVFITWNNTLEKGQILSPSTTPQLSVLEGLFFSMNIPFLFYQLIYHNQHYLDGALFDPYPILPFDDGQRRILGFYVHTKPKTVNNFNGYLSQIFYAFFENRYLQTVYQTKSNVTHMELYIDNQNYQNLSHCDYIAKLLNIGYESGYKYLFESENKQSLPSLFKYTYLEPDSP